MKWFYLGVLGLISCSVFSSERIVISDETWKSEVKVAIAQQKDLNNYWVETTDYRNAKIQIPLFHMSLRSAYGDAALAKEIVNSGYDVTIQDDRGVYALNYGCAEILDVFPDIRIKVINTIVDAGQFGLAPSNAASCFSYEEILNVLVQKKVKFDFNQTFIDSPLFFYLFKNLPLSSFKKLMYQKPDFSLRGSDGYSVLHDLVRKTFRDDEGKIAFLVEQGVNINGRDDKTRTPLMLAVMLDAEENFSFIQSLIESKAIIRLELKNDVGVNYGAGMDVLDFLSERIKSRKRRNVNTVKLDKVYRYLLEQDDIQRL